MTMSLQDALQRTIEHREIFHDEMLSLMRRIMSGEVSPVMIAALVIGLRVKKETIGEIAASAQVMREFATKVEVADRTHLVDIVGTGGDGSHTFNISTCSMFVAAAADLGQQQVHHLLEQLRVAPEGVEGGVEQRLLLVALEHHRAQGRVHVVAPVQPHQFHRRQRGPAVNSSRSRSRSHPDRARRTGS